MVWNSKTKHATLFRDNHNYALICLLRIFSRHFHFFLEIMYAIHFAWFFVDVFFQSLFSAITLATVYLSEAQQETNGCNTNCSSEWNSQICATNDEGKTKVFPSECVMKSENCLNKSSKQFHFFLSKTVACFKLHG